MPHTDPTTPQPAPPASRITLYGPNDEQREYHLADDDTLTIEIDGTPIVGFDASGAGWWPDPDEAWQPLRPDGVQTDRTVSIDGITTEALWHDLEAALGLAHFGLGRWKEWAAGKTKIFTADYDLDAAVTWAISQGLPYEDERSIRYNPPAGNSPTIATRRPLIQIDASALRTWLAEAQDRGDHPSPHWHPTTHDVTRLVEALTGDESPLARQAWFMPRATAVFACRLTTGEVVTGADLKPHGRICTAPLYADELHDGSAHIGVDAAAHTITCVARRLNQADPTRHRPTSAD